MAQEFCNPPNLRMLPKRSLGSRRDRAGGFPHDGGVGLDQRLATGTAKSAQADVSQNDIASDSA